ncbi:MAG: hypothetical protein V2J02_00500 [Pseudomonadales bacterium]|jgi:hypothetical protein|nr:hypothetical protein [Pseudomonadales bacterium]
MLYVVLIPGWVWVAGLAGTWATAAHVALVRAGIRNRLLLALLGVMVVQAVAAASTALVTSHDPLAGFACLMGYLGMWVALGVTLLEAIAVVFLVRIWPRVSPGRAGSLTVWTTMWLLFNGIAWLAHLRSAALCTV